MLLPQFPISTVTICVSMLALHVPVQTFMLGLRPSHWAAPAGIPLSQYARVFSWYGGLMLRFSRPTALDPLHRVVSLMRIRVGALGMQIAYGGRCAPCTGVLRAVSPLVNFKLILDLAVPKRSYHDGQLRSKCLPPVILTLVSVSNAITLRTVNRFPIYPDGIDMGSL